LAEPRLKIAVFIDFDNIEIGVKSTLNAQFDVGTVLEAIKERGEIVTKIAYGDWQRSGDYSRALTQHAIHMVQRNLTPGGDKNGADINLALDALEMAFTHNHINAYVIVSGDSDFIALVEKLKQYDKKVIIVGGRAFTSHILQKNCTEFVAYENLTGRRGGERGGRQTQPDGDIRKAFPLVKRALKVLSEREVSPQLGLLKSTLLQLDSTFSEREYGAGSFRDFVQKLSKSGLVALKGTDRTLLVELRDGETPATASHEPPLAAHTVAPAQVEPAGDEAPGPAPALPQLGQPAEGARMIRLLFQNARVAPRWPMYVRNVRQFLKAVDDTFDERRYGFQGIIDALRVSQREGVVRLERDRRGVLRVFPGPQFPAPSAPQTAAPEESVSEVAAAAEAQRDLPPAELFELKADGDEEPQARDEEESATPPHGDPMREPIEHAALPLDSPPAGARTRARRSRGRGRGAAQAEGAGRGRKRQPAAQPNEPKPATARKARAPRKKATA
jgi:uncharacterized LabA/DUF88 family protein